MTCSEDAEVAWSDRQQSGEPLAVLLVAVCHQDDGVVGGDVERLEIRRGDGKNLRGARESLRPGELGAAIDDEDSPSQQGCHVDERFGVIARTKDEQALGRSELFSEDAQELRLPSFQSLLDLFSREAIAREENLFRSGEDSPREGYVGVRKTGEKGE